MVISVSLQKLFLDRVRAQGPEWVDRVVAMEGRLAGLDPERGLNYLKAKLAPLIEGPDGIAADCCPRHLRVRRPRTPTASTGRCPHRARGGALPVLPLVGPAPPPRRQDDGTSRSSCSTRASGAARRACRSWAMLNPDNDYRPRIYP